MSILVTEHPRVTQGINARRPVPHGGPAASTPWRNCFVAGVNPKEGWRGLRGRAYLRRVREAKEKTASTSRGLRAAGRRRGGDLGGGRGDLELVVCHHRGHPVRDMVEVRTACARSTPHAAARAELPRVIHARGKIKIGIMPGQSTAGRIGACRARHPDYEAWGSSPNWASANPPRWASRRPGQRPEARRRAELFNDDPDTDAVVMIGRDRRLRRGDRGRVGQAAHAQADRRLHRRRHRAARKADGSRRRNHLRRQGHGAGEARRHGSCGIRTTKNPSEIGKLLKSVL